MQNITILSIGLHNFVSIFAFFKQPAEIFLNYYFRFFQISDQKSTKITIIFLDLYPCSISSALILSLVTDFSIFSTLFYNLWLFFAYSQAFRDVLLCFSSLSSLFPSLFSSLFPSSLPSLFHSATPFSISLFIPLYTKKSIPYTIPAPIPTDLQFASSALLIHNLTYVHFPFYFKHQKKPIHF